MVDSKTQVKAGYRLVIYGPNGEQVWERPLSKSSFEDNDARMYLGEQVIEALPEDAFEPYEGDEQ